MQHARWKAMGGQENSLLGGLNVGDQLETVISYTKRICHQTCVLQTRILVYWGSHAGMDTLTWLNIWWRGVGAMLEL